ncbi:MAG TPA: hypothetical protein VHH35_07640, partial [Pyrinomonadaceae bacterium]|nr:hypothetical protein [Pyrinomonadaceae bacterium]
MPKAGTRHRGKQGEEQKKNKSFFHSKLPMGSWTSSFFDAFYSHWMPAVFDWGKSGARKTVISGKHTPAPTLRARTSDLFLCVFAPLRETAFGN